MADNPPRDRSEIIRVVGALAKALKIQRNSLCFCGSASKFKKCCGSLNNNKLTFLDEALEMQSLRAFTK